ncbi:MAG: hypothetical protein KJI71_01440 [Patescibacteria group bacterium]|nr:hypothetical protein [Patescibacteria group bacterium]
MVTYMTTIPIPKNAKWNGFKATSKKNGKQFFWHINSLIKRRYKGTVTKVTIIPFGRKKKACNLKIEFETSSGLISKWVWNNIPLSCVQEKEDGLYVECRFAKQHTTPADGVFVGSTPKKKIPVYHWRQDKL